MKAASAERLILATIAGISLAEIARAVSIEPPTDNTDIASQAGAFLQWLLSIAGSVALLMLIYGGIVYIVSAGNPEKAEQGKRIVTWTLYGLLVVLMSYSIISTIEEIFVG